MKKRQLHTLILGSGAAGLTAAIRLNTLGIKPIAVYTEGLRCGTSINTGSDKQTYYKLGMYGTEPDSPVQMAADLMAGGSMHGDIALIEAALSVQTFMYLVNLGVPFPHDQWGEFIGYKTDHDPKRRATSCGPYTSRYMCLALTDELKRRQIEVQEQKIAIRLLTGGNRCLGAIFLDRLTGELEAVFAQNTVFAVGGPGGLYADCVYPKVHTGAIGLALEAGAAANNLAESQFGLASLKFRWNVSGSYMQVLPRFISVDAEGKEREFLREYFEDPAKMYDTVFLKGYQWPFAAAHVPGSSLIDIFTYVETVERGRRVYLDYRTDPADLNFDTLSGETREYLTQSGAWGTSPLERLQKLNAPAVGLYRQHGIDLAREPLEIAVCAQHCNGGLAGDLHWESVNLKNLFPIGEVNGTHGVTRPGGSALNAGQVGAFRAAEAISIRKNQPVSDTVINRLCGDLEKEWSELQQRPSNHDWREERQDLQKRMSAAGAFVRNETAVAEALKAATDQQRILLEEGIRGLTPGDQAEVLRNRQLLSAQIAYLFCIREQIRSTGSRGGSLVLDPHGQSIHPKLADRWRFKVETPEKRQEIMMYQREQGITWQPCRPLPRPDGWFETVWKEYRKTFQQGVSK